MLFLFTRFLPLTLILIGCSRHIGEPKQKPANPQLDAYLSTELNTFYGYDAVRQIDAFHFEIKALKAINPDIRYAFVSPKIFTARAEGRDTIYEYQINGDSALILKRIGKWLITRSIHSKNYSFIYDQGRTDYAIMYYNYGRWIAEKYDLPTSH